MKRFLRMLAFDAVAVFTSLGIVSAFHIPKPYDMLILWPLITLATAFESADRLRQPLNWKMWFISAIGSWAAVALIEFISGGWIVVALFVVAFFGWVTSRAITYKRIRSEAEKAHIAAMERAFIESEARLKGTPFERTG